MNDQSDEVRVPAVGIQHSLAMFLSRRPVYIEFLFMKLVCMSSKIGGQYRQGECSVLMTQAIAL